MLQVATAQQHTAAARRDEEKMHSAAASTHIPAAKIFQANFTGTLKRRGKARGVTALFTTHLNCNGGQEMELYSSEKGNSFGFGVSGGPG